MAYNAVAQGEHDALDDESPSLSPLPHPVPSHSFQPLSQMDLDNSPSPGLFMDHQHERGSPTRAGGLATMKSIISRSTKGSYEFVEDDDYSQHSTSASPVLSPKVRKEVVEANGYAAQDLPKQPASHDQACGLTQNIDKKLPQLSAPRARRIPPDAPLRTASGRRAPLRHPTPDLQTLQGAYMANVEHLEKTAEKLSMTSSIEDAIRQLHDVQKRSDSRKSSLLASSVEMPVPTRQFSNSGSIVDINNTARSGGFSPGGFNVAFPREVSSTTTRARSSSKGSKFGSRPEPELEGRPLDSFANFSFSGGSPALSLATSVKEHNESTPTMTVPSPDLPAAPLRISNPDESDGRPTTSASATTYEQAQKLFSDFDGEHFAPLPNAISESGRSAGGSQLGVGSRISSGNRLSMARPQSYADPINGQKMVYYPAPVPMMLNLPQKISKLSQSEAARAKRRSQVLSSIPTATRQSAIWLPDVLEDEGDAQLGEDDPLQKQEYLAQHQRATMGGRRHTQDLQHLPPQLRASAFFDVPGASQLVEVKEESAVKTLDSILDASAYAPVSAFTDHLIAGKLGAEVYGNRRTSKPMNAFTGPEAIPKRKSFADLLRPRRTSSSELLGGGRSSTWGRGDFDKFEADEDGTGVIRLADGQVMQEEAVDEEEEDEDAEKLYEGAPTTLLAELQLRKQRQKERTRPVASAYPNGMHSTLLELDAVAQLEKKSRGQKRVNLAWEDPTGFEKDAGDEGDEDVPLAMLFPGKSRAHQDQSRPMGLMERREMEDNEPLSRRRDRLQGRPRAMPRASTMIGGGAYTETSQEEGETLAQRVQRLKAQGGTATGLPAARPVSGDFTSELMSQFGGDAMKQKGKGKEPEIPSPPEEEETLGQRRKRLQAEREAREKEVATGATITTPVEERPPLKKQHSMADILSAHPSAGAGSRVSSYGKPVTGLLGLHEQQSAQRSSTMLALQNPQLASPPVHNTYNAARTQSFAGNNAYMNMGYQPQQQAYQTGGAAYGNVNPYAAMGGAYGYNGYGAMNGVGGGYANPMAAQMLQMQQTMAGMGVQGVAPLNQGQIEMVERWRQSVMQ